MRRLVFDAGPFILLFTREKGSNIAREAVLRHERGELQIFMHPNNLSEAYGVISKIREEAPKLLERDIDPVMVIRSAYENIKVVQDEITTINLGRLKHKYRDKPWGILSSAALAIRLSYRDKVPVIILDEERHFEDIDEVSTVKISDLKV
ncbi:hypothetical protein KEJ51_08460 [Candidatus Bathyarchaeota archaeon]|nr:hypothetical protein [Candidatus Bathyarchaeota archaeon]MBS7629121.1 hypothetical protein [Candidatus Bathyarchaeota archaeon]